jgi:hypothetical protein
MDSCAANATAEDVVRGMLEATCYVHQDLWLALAQVQCVHRTGDTCDARRARNSDDVKSSDTKAQGAESRKRWSSEELSRGRLWQLLRRRHFTGSIAGHRSGQVRAKTSSVKGLSTIEAKSQQLQQGDAKHTQGHVCTNRCPLYQSYTRQFVGLFHAFTVCATYVAAASQTRGAAAALHDSDNHRAHSGHLHPGHTFVPASVET